MGWLLNWVIMFSIATGTWLELMSTGWRTSIAAIRDPGVRAIIATRGGKGAYRLAGDLDFDAAAQNRPLLVGFSEITVLHLALLKHANLSGVHGGFRPGDTGSDVVAAMTSTDPVCLMSDADNPTSTLTTAGSATGRLIGGNQDMIATASGWVLPSFDRSYRHAGSSGHAPWAY